MLFWYLYLRHLCDGLRSADVAAAAPPNRPARLPGGTPGHLRLVTVDGRRVDRAPAAKGRAGAAIGLLSPPA